MNTSVRGPLPGASTPAEQTPAEKLELLRAAAKAEPYPNMNVRLDRLRRATAALIANKDRIVEAMDADFGGRPEALTLLADVMAPVNSLKHAQKNLARWMRPEKRKTMFPLGLLGGRARVHHQPLGVVGIVVPWNAPMGIGFTGLAGVLAAGNRAMIKPSELGPHSAALIAEMVASAFDTSEVCTVLGGVAVARQFTELAFDHLLFTGGPGTARAVMAAAARNLVPVTLELGGKSPVIVANGADLNYAAGKTVVGKLGNAGQVCMGVDFAMIHQNDATAFALELRRAVERHYPDVLSNPDFANVHLERQRDRLCSMVEDALAKGARVEVLGGLSVEGLRSAKRFPPVLVFDPPPDCILMREEIFGPVLPVVSYTSLESAVEMINSQTRPLAMYFLGGNAQEKNFLLKNTHSGGVTFGDVMLHPLMQDLPFGGVGESGMGRYLGYDGFKTFSSQRGVFERPWIDISRFFAPPYTPALAKRLRSAIGS